MALKVKILSENLSNKIAAGEVVERPASVVKELVENALDAGSTEIRVETASGGRRLIRVTDNGQGMSREDALLALERHATSKITSDTDLDSISTLGFRGEALPAIASVSRLLIKTREPGSIEGTEIQIEGGRIKNVLSCGMAPGTDITVEHLFFNTPARLKFMRTTETEAAHLGDLMVRLAISRSDVAFSCTNDGREQFRVTPGNLLYRLEQLIARGSRLFPFQGETDAALVSGYLAPPDSSRSSTSSMFTFINGRFVKDKVVQHAILQAWRPVLEKGRYPLLALFIELPHTEVDVNVHPTKHEVRFRRQRQVHDTIQGVISEALSHSPWLQTGERSVIQEQATVSQISGLSHRQGVQQALDRFMAVNRQNRTQSYSSVSDPAAPYRPEPDIPERAGYFSGLQLIGQFQAAYILCQTDAELVIIDQHAAYERVRFEHLKTSFNSGSIESQRLLLPETVELSFEEADAARRHNCELELMGFELEEFGGQTFRLNGVPQIVSDSGYLKLLKDILSDIVSTGATGSFELVRDKLLSRIACHGVVRGSCNLDRRQIEQLLQEMDRTDFSAHCPHGRPVSHTISLRDLEKIFRRT